MPSGGQATWKIRDPCRLKPSHPRIVLAGLIHYNAASVLVFDMHNEYGFDDTASDTGLRVIGLKTKFGTRVRVVGLGGGTQIRGQAPDFNLEIDQRDIQPGDIEMLSRALNLTG